MVAQKNIIKKVEIGVNTPSYENGLQLKDGLDAFFKEKIFPEMDAYFNSIQGNDSKIIKIENISLEINIKEKDLFNDLKTLIINELKYKIKQIEQSKTNSEKIEIVTSEQNDATAFFYFLERGSFPWWFSETSDFWEKFIQKIHFGKDISETLKTKLFNTEIRKRLIFQFNDKQLFTMVSSFVKQKRKPDFKIDIPLNHRFQFWECLIHYSLFKNKKEIIEKLQKIPFKEIAKMMNIANENFGITIPLKKTDFKKMEESTKNPKEMEHSEKPNEMELAEDTFKNGTIETFIKNAGLILLHPFLKMFFEKLDLLSEKKIKPEKIDETIHLLHYLATGKEQPYENELVFEKFLCNVPLQQPINRNIELTKDQKIACEVLLQAVLGHWESLKSKSTGLLQNEFLQREGKLILSKEKQTLIIERKAQDLLLDKLPWNIHLVKIPWKEKIIFVEW